MKADYPIDPFRQGLKMLGSKTSKSLEEEYGKRIEFYFNNIKRYNEEKAEIQREAKKFESLNEDAQKHAQIFGIAVISFKSPFYFLRLPPL
jgi:hypothetical protein